MIDPGFTFWLLTMAGPYGIEIPIAEFPTASSCALYQTIYDKNGHSVRCEERYRPVPNFRPPTHRKNNGSVSTQGSKTFRPTA